MWRTAAANDVADDGESGEAESVAAADGGESGEAERSQES